MRPTLRLAAAAFVALAVPLAALIGASPAPAATAPLTVWVDQSRLAVFQAVFSSGTYAGHPITFVPKDLAAIPNDLKSATVETAPDVITVAHDVTADLVATGLVAKIDVPARAAKNLLPYALDGFRYGSAVYGIPYQIENVAMITNADLVPQQPTTFTALSAAALALRKAGKVTVPFAVAQAPNGDAYSTYPLFSGLGGYTFGVSGGSVDVSDVGIANETFLANSGLIDTWNKKGLVNSALDAAAAKQAFVSGAAPFWITGPWDLATLKSLAFRYRVTPVPPIVTGLSAVPLIGAQGAMVTSFAAMHGLGDVATAFVTKAMAKAGIQGKLAAAGGRTPASIPAIATIADPVLKAFSTASAGGVPIPNVPQMSAVWPALGRAWLKSTQGAKATPAAKAFAKAQRTVVAAVG